MEVEITPSKNPERVGNNYAKNSVGYDKVTIALSASKVEEEPIRGRVACHDPSLADSSFMSGYLQRVKCMMNESSITTDSSPVVR